MISKEGVNLTSNAMCCFRTIANECNQFIHAGVLSNTMCPCDLVQMQVNIQKIYYFGNLATTSVCVCVVVISSGCPTRVCVV